MGKGQAQPEPERQFCEVIFARALGIDANRESQFQNVPFRSLRLSAQSLRQTQILILETAMYSCG